MLDRTATDWQALAGQLSIEGRDFINGRFVDALSGETRPTNKERDLAEMRQKTQPPGGGIAAICAKRPPLCPFLRDSHRASLARLLQ